MRTRRRRRQSGENLDSLLDTMANVVGILVVVVAVTQIHVGEAMKRIRAFASEEITELESERETLLAQRARTDELDNQTRLERIRLESQLARLRRAQVPAAAPAVSAGSVARVERAVAGKRETQTALRLELEGLGGADEVQERRVRLPDPRPPPPGASEVAVFCRFGRAFAVDLVQLKQQAEQEVRGLLARQATPAEIVDTFARSDLGDAHLRWRAIDLRGAAQAYRLDWREADAGEPTAALDARNSAYRRSLVELDPGRHYLHFHVWGDSFAAYLEARRLAEEAGYSVGWRVLDEKAEIQFVFGPRRPEPIFVD